MPTADSDASLAVDGAEAARVPALTVTGTRVLDGGGNPAQGLVEFDAGQLHVSPGLGGAAGVYEAVTVAQVYAGVMTAVLLPDCRHAFSSAFTYTVTVKAEGAPSFQVPGVVVSTDVYPSGTCDLSQLV